jgi:DNA-directed RNA polymerase I, II, and III subunit RPABC3
MDKLKLIDETIQVVGINIKEGGVGGKVFEKVSRISAKGQVMSIEVELDVNTDIYPIENEAFYNMVLASSVNTDGSTEFDILTYDHQGCAGAVDGLGSLMDKFDYVMHGKIFKYAIKDQRM